MRIYNSQTHKKEELHPICDGKISMYVCGPTVYDQIHIGNARTFLAFDVIRRYLIHKGYAVMFAQNLTDVDDKIIKRAQDEGKEAAEVAHTFSDAFIEQMQRLGVLAPDIRPRATEEIDQMIEMIEGLIEKGHAYAADNGDVYFSVRSCATYGSVSGRKVDELLVGVRIEENEDKKDPLDFALWKAAKPGEPSWKSPWGEGRPGWHTECSAMVHKYLGTPIDIHGGGADLIFPHHENEAAQASGCWSEPLANLWMHTGMLRVDGEKMSKSLGNFFTLKEVLDEYPADALRLLTLQTHYRSSMDFSFERLKGATGRLEKLASTVTNLDWIAEHAFATPDAEKNLEGLTLIAEAKEARAAFEEAMDDDFNSASALAAIFDLQNKANKWLETANPDKPGTKDEAEAASKAIQELLSVFGVNVRDVKGKGAGATGEGEGAEGADNAESAKEKAVVAIAKKYALQSQESSFELFASLEKAMEALIEARDIARKTKDFATADAIRDELTDAGFTVEDTPQGMRVKE